MEFISYSFLKKYLLNFTFILSLVLSFVLIWKYLIPYILPFIIAYFLSLLSTPVVKRFDNAGISRTLTALICTFFLYFGLGSGVYFIIRRLFSQLSDFASMLMEQPDKYFGSVTDFINRISERYPKLFSLVDIEPIKDSFMERIMGYAGVILEKTAETAMNMPNILLFLFAMVFSTYYFIKSRNKNVAFFEALPKSFRAIIFYCKNLFVKYLRHYLASMLIMLVIVFFMLIIGFSIMKIPYFILISLVVALIDMLPILGVGTVLIPWSVYCFIDGKIGRGIGLVILYILILSVRQILEPRLIGKKVGLSPLVTLISIYIGFRAFGIMGIIFAPFVAMTVSSLLKSVVENANEQKAPHELL